MAHSSHTSQTQSEPRAAGGCPRRRRADRCACVSRRPSAARASGSNSGVGGGGKGSSLGNVPAANTSTWPKLPPLPSLGAAFPRGGIPFPFGGASTRDESPARSRASAAAPVAAVPGTVSSVVAAAASSSVPALNPSPVADESRGTTLLTQLAAPPGVPRASDVAAPSGAGGDPRPQAPSTPPPPGANGQPDDSLSLMAGLWPVAKPLWPHLAVALAAQLTGAVIFLLTPRAFGRVLDSVSPQAAGGLATSGMFMASIVALGALYAGQVVAAFLQTWLLSSAGERLALRLRCAAFESLLKQEPAFFDASASGELVSRLTADVATIVSALQSAARGCRAIVEAVGALCILSCTSLQLTLVALGVAPVAVLLSQRLGGKVKQLSRAASEALADSSAVAEEAVTNVRTLQSFVREADAAARYARRAERAFKLQQRIALQTGLLEGCTRAAGNAGAITILAVGGALVAGGALSVGALTSFVIYTLYISGALGTLSACYGEIKRAEGTGARLFDVLRRQPAIIHGLPLTEDSLTCDLPPLLPVAPPQPAAPKSRLPRLSLPLRQSVSKESGASGDGAAHGSGDSSSSSAAAAQAPGPPARDMASTPVELDLRGVSFAFPSRDTPVLCDVSINVAPGSVTALVGPSGSGKSTVATLLQRLYDPSSGTVLYNGTNIRTLPPAWVRSRVAAVSQDPALFDATVADNIALGAPPGRTVTRDDVIAAARAANAHDFITAFPQGYDTRLGERGVALSGGQKQRLAIARAILKDAPVLILDEATSALDVESEKAVQEALERLSKGRTTLVIAHRFAALRSANSIYVLEAGRVVEQGTHAQLVAANGLYSRMYRLGRFAGPQAAVNGLADWVVSRMPAMVASRLGGGARNNGNGAKAADGTQGGGGGAPEAR